MQLSHTQIAANYSKVPAKSDPIPIAESVSLTGFREDVGTRFPGKFWLLRTFFGVFARFFGAFLRICWFNCIDVQ